ncbi:MAG: hypothetical protein IMF19_14790 [Proteobacteria bacterium]|nr:hypothetical protein [Pseudomonadota bacterium]
MGRPREMNEAKMVPVVLDREAREIVEKKKGDLGVSSYIRDLIKGQLDPTIDEEGIILKRQLEEAQSKIAAFERKEKAVTKEKAESMAYIAKGLELYKKEDSRRAEDPETCRRWIESRCKGSGISTSEFLSFHQNRK